MYAVAKKVSTWLPPKTFFAIWGLCWRILVPATKNNFAMYNALVLTHLEANEAHVSHLMFIIYQ